MTIHIYKLFWKLMYVGGNQYTFEPKSVHINLGRNKASSVFINLHLRYVFVYNKVHKNNGYFINNMTNQT